jgi:predicted amidohydrolase
MSDSTHSDTLRVALIQAQLRQREPAANREHLERLIRAAGSADLYLLPETFTTGFLGDGPRTGEPEPPDVNIRQRIAETMAGDSVKWLRALAVETGGALAGSMVIEENGKRFNRFLFASPEGRLHSYDKRHLFAFGGEDRRYTAGRERVIFEYRGWRICPQVCYDLRFPVWCRNRNDYDLLLFVANWPAPRVGAWDALLPARAIENQACVAAVNRVGADGNGIEYPGHSAAYDALGVPVVQPWGVEGTRVAEFSRSALGEVRENLPFAADADDFRLVD